MGEFSKIKMEGSGPSSSIIALSLLIGAALIRLMHRILERETPNNRNKSSHKPIRVDRTFLREFYALIKLCMPKFISKEGILLALLTFLLCSRTRLTLAMAKVSGKTGKALVHRDTKSFYFGLMDLALWAISCSVVQVGSVFVRSTITQLFRDNLESALINDYFDGKHIYVLTSKEIIQNPDQRIAQGVKQFCSHLTDLFESALMPILNTATISYVLSKNAGIGAPMAIVSYFVFVSSIIDLVLPNFSSLISQSCHNESAFRSSHNQLIVHAEEVAFYGGEEVEKEYADRLIDSIVKHEKIIKCVKWWTGLLDFMLLRHGATCLGYAIVGLVVSRAQTSSASDLTELLLESTQLYIPLSRSVGSLLLLHKKVGALVGYAFRLIDFRGILKILSEKNLLEARPANLIIDDASVINFSNVDIISPSAQVLVRKLNLVIEKGNHLLIMGPNGAGKSALIRTLAGLWPIVNGTVRRPKSLDIYFLPQRVYLSSGTLREQLIYPSLTDSDSVRPKNDAEILRLAEAVGLSQVVEREGGLDNTKNWNIVLSGGERQRVALVRVMYHKPTFAFLDEATCAVSQLDEVGLYKSLQKEGITLISITHHQSLKAIHNTLLEIKGNGEYEISSIKD